MTGRIKRATEETLQPATSDRVDGETRKIADNLTLRAKNEKRVVYTRV